MVLGPAHGDVEALSGRLGRQRADPSLSGCRDHAEEDDVAFVALERVGVSTNEAPFFDDLRLSVSRSLRSMSFAWASPWRLMTPMVAPAYLGSSTQAAIWATIASASGGF